MADPDLLVIVPSRGRPANAAAVIEAWRVTGAFDQAALLFALDEDDPTYEDYRTLLEAQPRQPGLLDVTWLRRLPMVEKLNLTAVPMARRRDWFALGFAGDDHLPRTPGWAGRYVSVLREMGCGIVYGDDLLQGMALPTQWAMTADIIRLLGAMVPAPVEHMFCDDAIRAVGTQAGCIRYLPDVVVEHVHPAAGKAAWDETYELAGGGDRLDADRVRYERWRDAGDGLTLAAARVRHIRIGMATWRL